jgi:hypothetical protein
MKLTYYCSQCDSLIEELDVDRIDEEKLGLSILTSVEKEDIIKETEAGMEIGIICDECAAKEKLISLVNNNLVH